MNLKELISQETGEYIDIDHAFGDQCVDLIQFYSVMVLGLKMWGSGNAIGRWTTYSPSDFDKIVYVPDSGLQPQLGDIVIWDRNDGIGHISIAYAGSQRMFTSFDQNWPIGSACRMVEHNYSQVVGWLRPKRQDLINGELPMTAEETQRMSNLQSFFDQVRQNKVAPVKVDGGDAIYLLYRMPSTDHANAADVKNEDIVTLPADWPIAPGSWPQQRDWLMPDLEKAESDADKAEKSLELSEASYEKEINALNVEKVSEYQRGVEDGKKVPPATASQETEASPQTILDYVKSILRKLTK